jgi:ribosomal protein S18 acetylase RimI-like enzyme
MGTITLLSSCADDVYEGISRLLGFLSGPERMLPRSQLQRLLCDPLFAIVVVRDTRRHYPQNIVGMASICYAHTLDGTIAEIHDVVVDPSCRGEGLGERLILALLGHARRRAKEIGGHITISLTSKPSRVAANKLYVKLGFTLIARHLRKNNECIGTNLYRMTITPSS